MSILPIRENRVVKKQNHVVKQSKLTFNSPIEKLIALFIMIISISSFIIFVVADYQPITKSCDTLDTDSCQELQMKWNICEDSYDIWLENKCLPENVAPYQKETRGKG